MRFLLISLLAWLSACTTLPPAGQFERPLATQTATFVLNGRISASHQEQRQSAGLRWIHLRLSDEMLLLAPLGNTVARVYRDAHTATLDNRGNHYQADNVEILMQQVLGWSVPLSRLQQWVMGLPDGDSSAHIERDGLGRASLMHQAEWEIRYLQYANASPDSLPSRIQLNHADLQVLLLIDRWEWNPQ